MECLTHIFNVLQVHYDWSVRQTLIIGYQSMDYFLLQVFQMFNELPFGMGHSMLASAKTIA